MSSRSDVRVLVTPTLRGVSEAIAAVPGVDVREVAVDDVADALSDAEVLVTFDWRDEWLMPNLRWIQSASTGVEQFPAQRLADAGIVLTSARGVHGPQMSEHVFGRDQSFIQMTKCDTYCRFSNVVYQTSPAC